MKKDVVIGLYNLSATQEAIDSAMHQTERIFDDIERIQKSFITLGFHLYEAKRYSYYTALGYLTFEEYCEKNFDLSRSSVSRYIDVWSTFCEQDCVGANKKMWIDSRYADYSYSQLSEMLSLSDEERGKITPDMTVKDIREKKKELKKAVATSHKVKCRFSPDMDCPIEEIQKKHFLKNGEVKGCAGCCSVCIRRSSCVFRCDLSVQEDEENVCDVAQVEFENDESENYACLDSQIYNAFILLGLYDDLIRTMQFDTERYKTMDSLLNRLISKMNENSYCDAFLICRNLLAFLAFEKDR